MKSFDTTKTEFTDNYKFMIGSILPRPIAFVTTTNEDGSTNAAPFSFFTGVSAKPFIVAFAPLIRTSTGEIKDTVKNIQRTKEFVINFTTEDNADLVNMASAELPYGEDELKFAGLSSIDSKVVNVQRVKESPIHFECKLKDIVSYGDTPGAGSLITGEVVMVHINEDIYDQGRINTSKFKPVGRGAGNDWFRTNEPMIKERLMKAQIQK